MKSPYDIILKPIISEDSMGKMEEKKYVFKVDKNANKIEIRKVVKSIWESSF